jgi:CheY-like chemotaxis protein
MQSQSDAMSVLVVEDNPADARLYRAWLGESTTPKFRVSHVTRLADASRRADAIAYDAVLLDLSLPDSTGLDTVTRFRDHNPDAAIVVVTGSDDERIATDAVHHGAHEYLPKDTLDARLLAEAITRAIARQRLAVGAQRLLTQVRASESRMRRILHAHPDGILLHDGAGRVLYANAAAEVLLGCRSGDPLPEQLVRPRAHWRGRIDIATTDDASFEVDVEATTTNWSDDEVVGLMFLRVVDEQVPAPPRMGSASHATLLASLDAMLWRVDRLRQLLENDETTGMDPSISEAIVLVGDLARFAEDARRIVGDASAHAGERDPSSE